MYYCEETGEFIHPIFFDAEEEAREVRADSTNQEVCLRPSQGLNEGIERAREGDCLLFC